MFDKQKIERVRLEAELKAAKEIADFQVESLREELELARDRCESLQGAHDSLTESHRSLLEVHREQTEDLKRANERIEELLKPPEQPVTFVANAPIHVSEDEDEARWQLDNGLIDQEMYNEILKEIGFQNTTVEIAR